ncbi:hypothetical protein [Candidatus Enterococcus murrayae]|uniref:Integral membrane protein n=1 Tax=Candidatus Enterococcus murrayae TaxID=2815321 RepID=A0ABS3HIV4_9ENTE|nr:hypothetical protein [Enterococcus sp. MJM16]MBO0453380.1 hypothetical protein [Enterococcus sp. MJM16]
MTRLDKTMTIGRKFFWILFFLAFAITAVTNLAIDQQFTWFRIVGSSLIFGGTLLDALLFSKNARVIHSVSVFTFLIVPYFMVLERTINDYFVDAPVYWLLPIGLPIALTWIAYFWINIGIRKLLHWNMGSCLGVASLTAIPAVLITNIVANQTGVFDVLEMSFITIVTLLACGGLGLITGLFMRKRNH